MAEKSQDLAQLPKVEILNEGRSVRVPLLTGDDIGKMNLAETGVPLLQLEFVNFGDDGFVFSVEGNIPQGAISVRFEDTESAQWPMEPALWRVDNDEAIPFNGLLAKLSTYGPMMVDMRDGRLLLKGEYNENRLYFCVEMAKCKRDFIIHLADDENEYRMWYDNSDGCIYISLNPTEVGTLS